MSTITIKAAHRKAVARKLDSLEGPFRRSDLSAALYPLTTPRSQEVAERLAEKLLRELASAGEIERHGHVHWVKVARQRSLHSGRQVAELSATTNLALTTHCPAKGLSIDLETGDVWAGTQSGWQPVTDEQRREALAILNSR